MEEKEMHWLNRAISPSKRSYRTEKASGDLKGSWKHLAPEAAAVEKYLRTSLAARPGLGVCQTL
eukprot:1159422-Pelagomonas_calceolata.AAC.3